MRTPSAFSLTDARDDIDADPSARIATPRRPEASGSAPICTTHTSGFLAGLGNRFRQKFEQPAILLPLPMEVFEHLSAELGTVISSPSATSICFIVSRYLNRIAGSSGMGPSSTRQPGRHAATTSVTFAAPFPAFGPFDPGSSLVICCLWGGVLDVHQRASLRTCSMPWMCYQATRNRIQCTCASCCLRCRTQTKSRAPLSRRAKLRPSNAS